MSRSMGVLLLVSTGWVGATPGHGPDPTPPRFGAWRFLGSYEGCKPTCSKTWETRGSFFSNEHPAEDPHGPVGTAFPGNFPSKPRSRPHVRVKSTWAISKRSSID
eukprot:scaffold1063_cov318-Pavlova_lutheri.AAC.9